jgi:hypothetical protein
MRGKKDTHSNIAGSICLFALEKCKSSQKVMFLESVVKIHKDLII